jgi:hypothetical protein
MYFFSITVFISDKAKFEDIARGRLGRLGRLGGGKKIFPKIYFFSITVFISVKAKFEDVARGRLGSRGWHETIIPEPSATL